jgi:hypothetical protein
MRPRRIGTLVKLQVGEDSALLPSLVTLTDVDGTVTSSPRSNKPMSSNSHHNDAMAACATR